MIGAPVGRHVTTYVDGRSQELSQVCDTYARSFVFRMLLRRVARIGNLWCQRSVAHTGFENHLTSFLVGFVSKID